VVSTAADRPQERDELAWVPMDCTLPTVEQPLRVAEFDALFATALHKVERVSATKVRLRLASAAEERARDLIARESSCCSFFTFTTDRTPEHLVVDIEAPANRASILDAFADRAKAVQS
jgi:hypothetical protein